jgi:hypothetical protein
VVQPWERQEGESLEMFQRFEQYLALGQRRTLTEIARRIGISLPSVHEISKRRNWKQRASAWDVNQNGESNIPKRKAARHAPPPPPPQPPASAIIPEVLNALDTIDDEDQSEQMQLYRDAFRQHGRAMLEEASHAQGLAVQARQTLVGMWEFRQRALESEDVTAATAATRSLVEMTNCYWKTIEVRCKLTDAARVHWGDSAALHELIREALGRKA